MWHALKWGFFLVAALAAAAVGGFFYYEKQELTFSPAPLTFDLKAGSSLRTVARELSAAGVIGEPVLFELIGRLDTMCPL